MSTEEGTGIVHIAPGFGEDDYNLMKGSGIPVVCPVDEEGKFTSEVPPWAGQFVKDADKSIIKTLKERALVLRHDSYNAQLPALLALQEPAHLPSDRRMVRERGEDQVAHARGQ